MERSTSAESSYVKFRVLVADDEHVIADTLVIILNGSGFEASAVYSGEMVIEAAKRLKPHMLISDVVMPDMNGIDAAIQVRKILPDCKILLFSGQAATANLLSRAQEQGCDFEILTKPVHPQDILARVSAMSDLIAAQTSSSAVPQPAPPAA
ncbi:MAG TPA: response regulator [Edaphobacter sp.]|nr:response regulator [Edaphobacter sp.]